jgi:hypothetical protein
MHMLCCVIFVRVRVVACFVCFDIFIDDKWAKNFSTLTGEQMCEVKITMTEKLNTFF